MRFNPKYGGTQPAVCLTCGSLKKARYAGSTPCCNLGHGEMTRVAYSKSRFLGRMSPEDRIAWVKGGAVARLRRVGHKFLLS